MNTQNRTEQIASVLENTRFDTPITLRPQKLKIEEGESKLYRSCVGDEMIQTLVVAHEGRSLWIMAIQGYALAFHVKTSEPGTVSFDGNALIDWKRGRVRLVTLIDQKDTITLRDDSRAWKPFTITEPFRTLMSVLYGDVLPPMDWREHPEVIARVDFQGQTLPFLLSPHIKGMAGDRTVRSLIELAREKRTRPSRSTTPAFSDPRMTPGGPTSFVRLAV